MTKIAYAILSVGLCFYDLYHFKLKGEGDNFAIFFAIISALFVIL